MEPTDWGRGDTRRLSQRDYPKAVLELVTERDAGCYWVGAGHLFAGCGGNLQVDHLQPISRGGDNHWTNLAWVCERHNKSKGNRRKPK